MGGNRSAIVTNGGAHGDRVRIRIERDVQLVVWYLFDCAVREALVALEGVDDRLDEFRSEVHRASLAI
ncbi:MAG TPA: hypothetical protein VMV10_28300 [Pirellulales bacterium]|nr:hypothetical protein [Pirellulales bacterium]